MALGAKFLAQIHYKDHLHPRPREFLAYPANVALLPSLTPDLNSSAAEKEDSVTRPNGTRLRLPSILDPAIRTDHDLGMLRLGMFITYGLLAALIVLYASAVVVMIVNVMAGAAMDTAFPDNHGRPDRCID